MSATFIERSLPLGDRDDDPPLQPRGASSAASDAVAERKPNPPVVPALDLHLPRIEQAFDDARMALADLKAARADGDLVRLASAAHRLKALSSHVATAVTAARRA